MMPDRAHFIEANGNDFEKQYNPAIYDKIIEIWDNLAKNISRDCTKKFLILFGYIYTTDELTDYQPIEAKFDQFDRAIHIDRVQSQVEGLGIATKMLAVLFNKIKNKTKTKTLFLWQKLQTHTMHAIGFKNVIDYPWYYIDFNYFYTRIQNKFGELTLTTIKFDQPT